MPTNDTLDPLEAANIAHNVYFTLENWIKGEAKFFANRNGGTESTANIRAAVLGQGVEGKTFPINTTLRGTGLESAHLQNVLVAQTGFRGITSGFGYTLTYTANTTKHLVIAIRGTRPEMGLGADVITDLRGAVTPFAGYGGVHQGFKKTFDSVLPSLARDADAIRNVDVIHCVGHSLGAAVATLIAAHFRATGKTVKLYTFGCPRVGFLSTHEAIEKAIGKHNIYRVSHDFDPVPHVAPYPYIHLNPAHDWDNMTLASPIRSLSLGNHDMNRYIRTVVDAESWRGLRSRAQQLNNSNARLAGQLLRPGANAGWVQRGFDGTLAILFKLFDSALKGLAAGVTLCLTPVDVLAEILFKGASLIAMLGAEVLQLLTWAAKWAGITIVKGANFTISVIQAILNKMFATLRTLTIQALNSPISSLAPISIGIAGGWALASYGVI